VSGSANAANLDLERFLTWFWCCNNAVNFCFDQNWKIIIHTKAACDCDQFCLLRACEGNQWWFVDFVATSASFQDANKWVRTIFYVIHILQFLFSNQNALILWTSFDCGSQSIWFFFHQRRKLKQVVSQAAVVAGVLVHCAKSYRPFELLVNENCKLRNELN